MNKEKKEPVQQFIETDRGDAGTTTTAARIDNRSDSERE
jgi:hypothetical protein